jgi:glyoxylase-like metal-dependent hydrolase (beta-lactamase superfamily II)
LPRSDRATRLFLLQFGAEYVPKAVSLPNGGSRLSWEPIVGMLVETSDGWILLETGMGRKALDDPAAQDGYRRAAQAAGVTLDSVPVRRVLPPLPPEDRTWTWGLGGEPMVSALAEHGLTPSDLALAAVSHLHLDHSGGLAALGQAGVRVAIQRSELEFVRTPSATPDEGFYAADWEDHDIDWWVIDGDEKLAPGLHVMFTPGHTPGHMSYRIELEGTGTWLFAVDAADLGENVHDEEPPGSCSGGSDAARRSLARLLTEARARDARLVPGHDQLIWNAARHPPGGHR